MGKTQISGRFVGDAQRWLCFETRLRAQCPFPDALYKAQHNEKTARHSARFYALRAAKCADGSRPIPTNLPATGYFHKSNLQKTQRTDANLSKPCFTAVSPFRHISPKRYRPQFCKIPCKNHHKLPHRFVQLFLRFLRAPAAKICTAEVCAYSSSGSPACMGAALPITSILF